MSNETLTKDQRLTEAVWHDVDCPCDYCKEFWEIADPEGEFLLPGQEPKVKQ